MLTTEELMKRAKEAIPEIIGQKPMRNIPNPTVGTQRIYEIECDHFIKGVEWAMKEIAKIVNHED